MAGRRAQASRPANRRTTVTSPDTLLNKAEDGLYPLWLSPTDWCLSSFSASAG